MPWKELDVKNLRYEFVVRSLEGKIPFGELCEEYGIQPKTGYKWKQRFLKDGHAGLEDRSRRPGCHPSQLSAEVVCEMVRLKEAHPKWGPRKIRDVYGRQYPDRSLPSESSFKRVLERAGLTEKRKRRHRPEGGRLEQSKRVSEAPNDIWTVDFKGVWYTPDGERCEPLTVRDDFSRYVLCARVPQNARTETIQREFERLFERYGLPGTIRSDNGRPFAATTAPLGLSRLSAWWLVLGIDLDRIEPGHPYQNGGHERMHLDIAREVEKINEGSLRRQTATLETWRQTFNRERPHQALGMRRPAEIYQKSQRRYRGTPQRLEYPEGCLQRRVHKRGTIKIEGLQISLTTALAGWNVGLKPQDDRSFSVHFAQLCLGIIDLDTKAFFTGRPDHPKKNP